MDQIKISSYWKPAVMLPLLVGAVAAGFGLVIGYSDAKSGFGMKMLSFAFELCMQSMAFTLPTALLYTAAAKLFKLRYTAAGILLSVILAAAAALIVIIMWLVVNAAALAVDQPWSVILVITTIPPLSAVAGAVASLLLPRPSENGAHGIK